MRKARNNRKNKSTFHARVWNYFKKLLSGSYTPPAVNVGFLALSVILILGVIYASIAKSTLTLLSGEPVDSASVTSKEQLSYTYRVYRDANLGFEVSIPSSWEPSVLSSESVRLGPSSTESYSTASPGYYLNVSVLKDFSDPGKFFDREENGIKYHYERKGDILYEFEYVAVNEKALSEQERIFYHDLYYSIIESFRYSKE